MDPSSFIGVIWDAAKCCCGCVQRESAFVFDLETNLKLLEDRRKKLEAIKKDVELQIEEAQNNSERKTSHQRSGWLERVEAIQKEITDIKDQGAREIQDKCLVKCCPKNCKSSYRLGKKATNMLKNVDQLVEEGRGFGGNFNIAHKTPPKPIEMPQDEVVGLGLMFNKVWKSIEDENVGSIGLYGMGGVGKTTLLKKINNELINELTKRRFGFDFVMWVVVSKEPNLESIMDNIRKLVGIGNDIWSQCSNRDEKAAKIYEVLKKKKFVLLLDDIWEKLDLKLVGVPHPKDTNFQSKVLFTTRLEDVCAKMKAQTKFKVTILTRKEAFELFCMKVGEETLSSHPIIPKLAEEMAKECEGLPLALIVVGSAMAGVKSVGAWQHSIKNLASSSWTAKDLETKVFSILKFSYDKLDGVEKRCFLYCALYPEDYEIIVPDLIDKWMWEKLLCKDMTMSVQNMHNHGESIIEKLKLSCLLESGSDDPFCSIVKIHDVIRDMALWLLKQDHDNRELVKRILIMNDWESEKTLEDPPNVTTLVLLKRSSDFPTKNQLEDIKCTMKRLKVLELNDSGEEFLDMSGLISLEYLSFHVRQKNLEPEFWISLQFLTNLKFLSFQKINDNIVEKWEIPLGVLSSLQQLKVFRLSSRVISVSEDRRMLEELESLPNIEELWIKINSIDGLNKLLESTKLQRCVYDLFIDLSYLKEKPLLSLESMSEIKQLQQIVFQGLDINSDQYSFVLETCFLTKLRSVEIYSCSVTHVTWLKYAPLLQRLVIDRCESMEEVIKEDEDVDSCVFSSLVDLTLQYLPRLESIHKAPLPFPSLRSICVNRCPELKKLPLDSNSAKYNKLTSIYGQQDWWDSLERDDPAAKHKFQSKFDVSYGPREFVLPP